MVFIIAPKILGVHVVAKCSYNKATGNRNSDESWYGSNKNHGWRWSLRRFLEVKVGTWARRRLRKSESCVLTPKSSWPLTGAPKTSHVDQVNGNMPKLKSSSCPSILPSDVTTICSIAFFESLTMSLFLHCCALMMMIWRHSDDYLRLTCRFWFHTFQLFS